MFFISFHSPASSHSFHPSAPSPSRLLLWIRLPIPPGSKFSLREPHRVTGNSITLEDALSFESSSRPADSNRPTEPQQQQQAVAEEIHTLSFAELKALIEEGKTDGIPNNKLIPNILNVSTPVHSHHSPRESPSPALSLGCSRTLHQTTISDGSEGNHGKHSPYPFLPVIY